MNENRVIYVFASIAALGFFYFFARDFIAAVVVLVVGVPLDFDKSHVVLFELDLQNFPKVYVFDFAAAGSPHFFLPSVQPALRYCVYDISRIAVQIDYARLFKLI